MLENETVTSRPVTIRPEASLKEAANLMKSEHIGNVFVTRSENDYPVGILTDRDLAIRVMANGDAVEQLKVGDVMTSSVVCAKTSDDPFTIVQLMKQNGVTRLPIVNEDEKVVGVVNARKLITMFSEAIHDLTRIGEKQQAKEESFH